MSDEVELGRVPPDSETEHLEASGAVEGNHENSSGYRDGVRIDGAAAPPAPKPETVAPSSSAKPPEPTPASLVVQAMSKKYYSLLERPIWELILLSLQAGGFLCIGAALSAVLSAGDFDIVGARQVFGTLGFTLAFSLVIVTQSALYTEVNVSLFVHIFLRSGAEDGPSRPRWRMKAVLFWVISFLGNLAGAFIVGGLLEAAAFVNGGQRDYGTTPGSDDSAVQKIQDRVQSIIEDKVTKYEDNGATGWFTAFASGIIANWMVGMASYNAVWGGGQRNFASLAVAVFFPILGFIGLGVEHSVANMGFAAVALSGGVSGEATFWKALGWNIIPSGLGNFAGSVLLVGWMSGHLWGPLELARQAKRHRDQEREEREAQRGELDSSSDDAV